MTEKTLILDFDDVVNIFPEDKSKANIVNDNYDDLVKTSVILTDSGLKQTFKIQYSKSMIEEISRIEKNGVKLAWLSSWGLNMRLALDKIGLPYGEIWDDARTGVSSTVQNKRNKINSFIEEQNQKYSKNWKAVWVDDEAVLGYKNNTSQMLTLAPAPGYGISKTEMSSIKKWLK